MIRRILIGILIFIGVMVTAPSVLFSPSVIAALVTGWWHFLKRNLSLMTWNWGLIVTGLICSAALMLIGHWLFGSLFKQAHVNRHSEGVCNTQWRRRWTLSLYAGIWLLFTIAFGAAGLFRQTSWLIKHKGGWYEARRRGDMELRLASFSIHQAIIESQDGLEEVRASIKTASASHGNDALLERFSVILYADTNNEVAAYVIIPRDHRALTDSLFEVWRRDTPIATRDPGTLEEIVGGLDAAFPQKRGVL